MTDTPAHSKTEIELTDAELSVLADVVGSELDKLRASVTDLMATGPQVNAHIAHHKARKAEALMGILPIITEGRGDGLDDLPYDKSAVEGVLF